MPPLKSLELERHIIDTFSHNEVFSFNGIDYEAQVIGKPRPSYGECKTDVYVKGIDSKGNFLELKISVKDKSTNEFQGNKLKAKDALAYFGEDWSAIVKKASSSISSHFENRSLIFAKKKHPTKENSITLGWKLEIANKARDLSAKIPLSIQEVRDYVFKGSNLSEEKKNAKIDGIEIENSGVANYLLVADISELKTTNDIINNLQIIDNYIPPQIYLIFTANNYRTKEDKADGPRSLAVQIEWTCNNGKLTPNFIYNQPLLRTGENDMKPILLSALEALGKAHPDEFSPTDVADSKLLYS